MYSLLVSERMNAILQGEEFLEIIILGSRGVGKSTIVNGLESRIHGQDARNSRIVTELKQEGATKYNNTPIKVSWNAKYH
jgi:putative ribosome biogenesis GTPase RsgA